MEYEVQVWLLPEKGHVCVSIPVNPVETQFQLLYPKDFSFPKLIQPTVTPKIQLNKTEKLNS